jgi:hypothetical protein
MSTIPRSDWPFFGGFESEVRVVSEGGEWPPPPADKLPAGRREKTAYANTSPSAVELELSRKNPAAAEGRVEPDSRSIFVIQKPSRPTHAGACPESLPLTLRGPDLHTPSVPQHGAERATRSGLRNATEL